MAMRIADHEDFVSSRSHCESCNHELGFLDLIPIVSYLYLKGRCRYCGAGLSTSYPLTEIFLGIVFVLTYLRYQRPCILLIFDLSLFCIVFGLSLIDMRSYIIPDGFIITGVLNWFVRSLFTGFEYGSIVSAFLLSLSIIFLSMIMNKANGKENFGGGDIKLIFMAVLYTGLMKGVLLLFVSSVLGLFGISIGRNKKIPFGPYISFALFLVLLYGDLMLGSMFL
ncbi:MAG: prepilin peptidase [Erysipelotrichaceae bacterium]|nr:prepilin peptidase [Erysipelotrichaceae bacterium]